MNINALFSDETANYVTPMEPKKGDLVTIRFRAKARSIDQVLWVNKEYRLLMEHEKTTEVFDFYKIAIPIGTAVLSYCFEIRIGEEQFFYNKIGVSEQNEEQYNFRIVPGFSTPDWAKGAVMYQIMVDRFYNADMTNDVVDNEYHYVGDMVKRVTDWEKCPAYMGVREFYGGDLQGVKDKLDYLQELGIDVIYFNPLFVSPSNHKYDIQDYDNIDPHFGKLMIDEGEVLAEGCSDNRRATKHISRVTCEENLESSNQLFIRVVREAHRRGIRVILDGVFNHCGSFNKWLDREKIYENQEGYAKGAYVEQDSPYQNFFRFKEERWPDNGTYDGWWGFDTLPKLAYEDSDELYQYILEIGKKWVSPPFNADGWRLDVAADLGYSDTFNHQFWKDFRKVVKEANPEALILAEHYGESRAWLGGGEWDTVMNYDAFMEPATWFFTGMEKHSDEYREELLGNAENFAEAMKYHMANFLAPSLQVAMNELSNHDHSRFLTRTNHKVGRVQQLGYEAAAEGVNQAVFREAVIMQMTWPGAPTIYYGDEAGVVGFTDPDNRRTYPWGREDTQLIRFHREMIRIHKERKVLIHGSVKLLNCEQNILSYGRFSEQEQVVVLINNGQEEHHMEIDVWQTGVSWIGKMCRIMLSDAEGFTQEECLYDVREGKLSIFLPPTSAMVLVNAPRFDR